ncbi:MAG: helix-hairpin-helix domain-containing protein [Deltaproteobacteria bacterium]|nr:helix-hairpin-helix domain-containing protein [Deltaproteobacteria bacterium]
MASVVLLAVLVAAVSATAAEAQNTGSVVNINTASAAELSLLPGVGPSKAQAIIKYRGKHQFKKIEDILRVRGIGRKSFKAMRPHLAVAGPTTAKKKIKPSK